MQDPEEARQRKHQKAFRPLMDSGTDTKSSNPRSFEQAVCKRCGAGFTRWVGSFGIPPRAYCEGCLTAAIEAQEQADILAVREKIRGNDGISLEDKAKTFDSFNRDVNPSIVRALDFMQGWANQFVETRGHVPSVILFSKMNEPGVGKTHMAIAAASYIERNWPVDLERPVTRLVRFESGPSLCVRIRATFNLSNAQRETHESEQQVMQAVFSVPLLILDDVGKELASDWKQEVYFNVIDSRRRSPMIVTLNLPIDGPGGLAARGLMNEPTVSRMIGMADNGRNYFKLSGEDYRRRR